MPRVNKNTRVDRLLGARLRAARKTAGYTQLELAEALGLKTVHKLESGETRILASTILKAAEFLKVDPAFFWDRLDEPLAAQTTFTEKASDDEATLIEELGKLRKAASRKLAIKVLRSLASAEDEELAQADPNRAR